MPSTRRIKVLGLIIALVVLSVLYVTVCVPLSLAHPPPSTDLNQSHARQSNQDFYERTVAAMEAIAKEKLASSSEQDVSKKLKEAAVGNKQRVETPVQRKPPEVALNEGTTNAEGRPKLKGGEKWDVSSGKDSPVAEPAENKGKTEEEKDLDQELNSILKRSPIIIFSKSYCPYSKKAKAILLDKYKIVPAPFVVELDKHEMGQKLQDTLQRMTGRRTVPNVLISGRSIGGGDDVEALDTGNKLIDTVKSMGGKRITEARLREDT